MLGHPPIWRLTSSTIPGQIRSSAQGDNCAEIFGVDPQQLLFDAEFFGIPIKHKLLTRDQRNV
jgi:hypothetical protein